MQTSRHRLPRTIGWSRFGLGWAGTGDEIQVTGFSHVELPLTQAIDCSELAAPADHPGNFWRHVGFSLVAVTPDDGPDVVAIHFAKNIKRHDRIDPEELKRIP